MKIQELQIRLLKKEIFSFAHLKKVPSEPGCYFLSTYSQEILYIGSSNNLQRRLKQHLEEGVKVRTTPFGIVYWFYFEICSLEKKKPNERGWINTAILNDGSLPFFNQISPP